ncbi:MAG TPA: aldose 1-epimerase [Casimicrobiaceae bacterium]|nr:aldose 1-epimerase [Casimicrobiaceae bacterium]
MSSQYVTLAVSDSTVEIAPAIGGAIASFRDRQWDVLRSTGGIAREQGNVRQFACYPLVPYSNRIAHARLQVGDDVYELARNFGDHPHSIHGIGWQRAWQLIARDDDSVLLELIHDPSGEAAHAWPFAFRARQAFLLSRHGDAAMLTATLSIENCDSRPFPCGLGWHPFFPRDATTALCFRAESIWRTDDTRLPIQNRSVDSATNFADCKSIADTRLDNVFAGWGGNAELRWPNASHRVSIEADRSLAFLVLFIPDDRGYLAIEPVTHMTDAFNRAARGEGDTGTFTLAPGDNRCGTMRIVSTPL